MKIPQHNHKEYNLRIEGSFRVFSTLHMDIKHMVESDRGCKYLLLEYIHTTLCIKQIFASPDNHRSLVTERFLMSITNLIISNLSGNGRKWDLYSSLCTYAFKHHRISRTRGSIAIQDHIWKENTVFSQNQICTIRQNIQYLQRLCTVTEESIGTTWQDHTGTTGI